MTTAAATVSTAYARLEARFARQADLGGALAVLYWDQQCMMPAGGAEARAEQVATLSTLAHELLTAAETGELLAAAADELDGLDGWQAANLARMTRAHRRARAIEPALVAAMARATSRADLVWRRARAEADFPSLAPALAEVIRLTQEEAAALGAALGLAPYDAMLDAYEPGLRRAQVDALLLPLGEFLPDFLERVLARQRPPLPVDGPFPVHLQKALGQRLMGVLGFDFAHGRLDESAHPFCGGIPDDVRITARYDEADAASGLMAVLHETGHALYNAGLPKDWRRQPVGGPCGFAAHESQSLLIEMQVCRSRPFLAWLAPQLQAQFGRSGPEFAPDNLYRRAIQVGRGFIRVDADEVTYPLHIILRYRLEQALLAGDLAVADLPGAWRDGMRALLGILPPTDREGCLQDIHWPHGAIGYFPCYTLGAIVAAQLFAAARAVDPDIVAGIARGEFGPLRAWLRANIHAHGARYELGELVRLASGRALALEPYLDHLQRRYLGDPGNGHQDGS
jgi:carboxypeptidase Taq